MDPVKYREYATQCRLLAKTAKERDKTALLDIAKAWEQCADNIEVLMASNFERRRSDGSLPQT
jgi:hypothetical protein